MLIASNPGKIVNVESLTEVRRYDMEIGNPDEQPDIYILPNESPIPVEIPQEDPIQLPEKEPAYDE